MKSTIVLFCTISLLTGFLGGWRSLIKAGNKSYKTGNFTKAKKIYQSAIDTKPDEPISNYNLGVALYQNKEFDQAEKYFLKSINQLTLGKQNKAYYNRGNSQFQMGNFEDAIRSYKSALRNNHVDLDSKHNLELALEKLAQQQRDQESSNNQEQANNENKDGNQNQQRQNSKQQQQNQIAPDVQKMSEADAIRLLEALKNDEHEIRRQILRRQIARQKLPSSDKDW
jgi:Ca-activated chloride channel family protein